MEHIETIERTLEEALEACGARPEVLHDAMKYAVGTGGKRIRPLICLAAAVATGGNAEDARHAAAAIELLHNYTLVHDDLPSMDNDTLRRGKPTVWTKFGEANAILAGDALQAAAFRVAALSPRNAGRIVATLAAAGVGVVQGQVEDIMREKDAPKADIPFIYEHKTADLFIAAAVMGGLTAGANEETLEALRAFALNLGLAFQYEDDLLDGDSPYNKEETEHLVVSATAAAKNALKSLPGDTSLLENIAERLVGRKN